jgi:hypothetical protein
MTLTTIASEAPHPLLGGREGGVVDQLRVVHDVFGHAALGVGFDLQSEYATWLQCQALFSRPARPAAFCELVGAVTAYVMTGTKPGLRAKLPPPELLGALAQVRPARSIYPRRTCAPPPSQPPVAGSEATCTRTPTARTASRPRTR